MLLLPVIITLMLVGNYDVYAQSESVSISSGSFTLGCENTNQCYSPYEVTIDVGDTVTWSNDDSAAHTVTSGNPSDGPNGKFDSSLIMAGGTFSTTFDEAWQYPYFCMLHPWMTGKIIVEATTFGPETPSLIIDPVVSNAGRTTIYYDFNGPVCSKYFITVNGVSFAAGTTGDFAAPITANNLMYISGVSTGGCVSTSFPATGIVAHFGIPYLEVPTPGLYCGQPMSFYDNIMNGTAGNDYLKGTSVLDLILGYGGNDILIRESWDDCLVGGTGIDTFFATDISYNIESDGSDTCVNKTYNTVELC